MFPDISRVEVTGDDGKVQEMTVEEYEHLPLSQRVKHLLGRQTRFYAGAQEVPAREAICQINTNPPDA